MYPPRESIANRRIPDTAFSLTPPLSRPPSRRAIAPLRRDGGWEREEVSQCGDSTNAPNRQRRGDFDSLSLGRGLG